MERPFRWNQEYVLFSKGIAKEIVTLDEKSEVAFRKLEYFANQAWPYSMQEFTYNSASRF